MPPPPPPRSQPIHSVHDLKRWRSGTDPYNVARIPLLPRSRHPDGTRRVGVQRVIVCHDFAGGYKEDCFAQGVTGDDAIDRYSLQHWDLVDDFIYFSHSRFSIPPAGWINSAHRNGVFVYGTLITEWILGVVETLKLLYGPQWTPEVVGTLESGADVYAGGAPFDPYFASKMVDVAEYYGFDGWFINIESELIDVEHALAMLQFVKHLTDAMKSRIPGSRVLWYDSLTIESKLKWQNHLNDLNRPFFDACDGIFINYTWTDIHPGISALNAGARKADVYTGIDVWGRKTFGGGGFNAHKALRVIAQAETSVAIFAPGWTHEALGARDFLKIDKRFWKGPAVYLNPNFPPVPEEEEPPTTIEDPSDLGCVADHVPARPSGTSSYFSTDFDRGFGVHGYCVDGKCVSTTTWHNLSRQSTVPSLHDLSVSRATVVEGSSSVDDTTSKGWKITGTDVKVPSSSVESIFDAYAGDSALVIRVKTSGMFYIPISRISVTDTPKAWAFLRTSGSRSANARSAIALTGSGGRRCNDLTDITTEWSKVSMDASGLGSLHEIGVLIHVRDDVSFDEFEIHVGLVAVGQEPIPPTIHESFDFNVERKQVDADTGRVTFDLVWDAKDDRVDRWEVFLYDVWVGCAFADRFWVSMDREPAGDVAVMVKGYGRLGEIVCLYFGDVFFHIV